MILGGGVCFGVDMSTPFSWGPSGVYSFVCALLVHPLLRNVMGWRVDVTIPAALRRLACEGLIANYA